MTYSTPNSRVNGERTWQRLPGRDRISRSQRSSMAWPGKTWDRKFGGLSNCVVYDWDSLFAASEAEMVGRAAAQVTAQWDTFT
ncbi:hypothetical protein [Halomicronema hongdechloris]|uniref:hypothetical protein n=1 Tax=Halomicronema hongdechloris TaxID=1209493 RepID=UPI0010CC5615|nr:hypothetical protein [Halomicronema hongdechloris]